MRDGDRKSTRLNNSHSMLSLMQAYGCKGGGWMWKVIPSGLIICCWGEIVDGGKLHCGWRVFRGQARRAQSVRGTLSSGRTELLLS